jgi:hypothetical protein
MTNDLPKSKPPAGQGGGIVRRFFRFVLVGIWESVYKRKKRRGLYRYHTYHEPPREKEPIYYSRYRWIKRGEKRPPPQKASDPARKNVEE